MFHMYRLILHLFNFAYFAYYPGSQSVSGDNNQVRIYYMLKQMCLQLVAVSKGSLATYFDIWKEKMKHIVLISCLDSLF